MLIVSTHIPKQHMHKKETCHFVIPSQSSVLQSHQIQKRNLRTNKHHHTHTKSAQNDQWEAERQDKTVKKTERHTLIDLCELQRLDHQLEVGTFALLLK